MTASPSVEFILWEIGEIGDMILFFLNTAIDLTPRWVTWGGQPSKPTRAIRNINGFSPRFTLPSRRNEHYVPAFAVASLASITSRMLPNASDR